MSPPYREVSISPGPLLGEETEAWQGAVTCPDHTESQTIGAKLVVNHGTAFGSWARSQQAAPPQQWELHAPGAQLLLQTEPAISFSRMAGGISATAPRHLP